MKFPLILATLALVLLPINSEADSRASQTEIAKAFSQLSQGNQSGAESTVNNARRLDPKNPDLLFLSGVLQRSRFERKSSAYFSSVMMLGRENSPEALASACILGIDLSRDSYSALYYFNALLLLSSQHPDSVPIHWMAAVMARTLTRRESILQLPINNETQKRIILCGIKEYERVLELLSPGIGPVLVHQTLANLLDNADAYDTSLEHRELALKMERKAWSLQAAAITFKSLDRGEEALALINEAIQMQPQYDLNQETLSIILTQLGRHQEALAAWQEALQKEPTNAYFANSAAKEAWALGDYPTALSLQTTALSLDPKNRSYAIRVARLAALTKAPGATENVVRAGTFDFRGNAVPFGDVPKDPWFAAVQTGDQQTVERMLPKVDVNASDPTSYNQTPLMIAAEKGWEPMIPLFLRAGAKLDAIDKNGDTPLHYAAQFMQPRCMKLLLDAGAKTDLLDTWQQTPLLMSSTFHDWEGFRLLLEHGANFNLGADKGTPLHFAAGHGDLRMIKALLAKKANVNLPAKKDGTAPLQYACKEWPYSYVVSPLLDAGANINAKDSSGRTALHDAVNPIMNIPLVELLLNKGADPTLQDNNGVTPITEARLLGFEEMAVRMEAKAGHAEPFRFPDFPPPNNALSPEEKRASYYVLPILLAQGNPLGGCSGVRADDKAEACKELEWMFGIQNAEELRANINDLIAFEPRYRDEAGDLPSGISYPNFLAKIKGAALYLHASLDKQSSNETAWTRSHIIYLADLGVSAGYLSAQEGENYIVAASNDINRTFTSWQGFLQSFELGARFYNGWEADRYKNITRLIARSNQPWP